MDRAGHVEERLVDRDPLDERREVAQHVDDLITEALVLAEVAADEPEARAQLPGEPARHPGSNAERLGLVRRGEDDATADGDRHRAEAGVDELLHRRVERVEIGVKDRGPRAQRHTRA